MREVEVGDTRGGDETLELRQAATAGPWWIEVGAACGPVGLLLREGERVVFGSGRAADLRVADRTVSGRHCGVRVERGRAVVEDLGSTNGVVVGGARVERAILEPGASFVAGRAVVTCGPAPALLGASEPTVEPLPGVIGSSTAMQEVARQVRRIAAVRGPVLLRGETGAGKDVLARAIHAIGPRHARAYVPLNVGTLPRELADAELFGHERGAFTGAHIARDGAFTEAHGGTLFLDEVAELTPDLQVKLLRVLEDGEVRAVGARLRRKVDVRVVSATWASLDERVGAGSFRADLYQRLAVFLVDVPPLRDRRSDIPALAEHVLRGLRDEVGAKELTPGAVGKLAAYGWPGNVRELRNVLYRAALRASAVSICTDDVARSLHPVACATRAQVSSDHARELLERHEGNASAAARALGVPRSTFRDWLSGR